MTETAEQIRNKLRILAEPAPEADEPEQEDPELGIFDKKSNQEEAPEPRIQENNPKDVESARNFKVGDYYWRSSWRDARLERQGLPHPLWPRPGQPATPEEYESYHREHNLWMRSSLLLESCIFRRAGKLSKSPYGWTENTAQAFAEDWHWLTGLWNARGLPVPTEEQLTEWAKAPRAYATKENRVPYQIQEPIEK